MVPDIETDPLLVQKEGERSWIRLQPSAHRRREADYEWHLEHPSARQGEKPMETVSYLLQPKPGDKAHKHGHDEDEDAAEDPDERGGADDDRDQKTDFLIDFARDLLAQAKTGRRRELVHGVEGVPRQGARRRGQEGVAGAGEAGRRLDRRARRPARRPAAAADAAAGDGRRRRSPAGTLAKLRGVVKNVGRAPAYRVRAVLESDNPIFDENEMVFGKIAPGESKSYELAVKVPASSFTRTDEIKATLYTPAGRGQGAGRRPAGRTSRARSARCSRTPTRPSTTRRAATTTARCSAASRCACW